MVSKVIKGASETFDLYLKDNSGNPLLLSTDVNYEVRDLNSDLIISGIATQDTNDSSHWFTIIVVPESAPVAQNGSKYSIIWYLTTEDAVKKEITELFEVVGDFEEQQLDYTTADEAILQSGGILEDYLSLNSIPEDYKVTLVNDLGTTIFEGETELNPNPVGQQNGKYIFKYTSPTNIEAMIAGNAGVTYYQAIWSYTINSINYSEIHPIYVLNNRMWMFMNNLKCEIAQDILCDINPNLTMKNSGLLYAVNKGLQRINSTPPTNEVYTFGNLPQSLYYVTQQAATVAALKKMFLIEGLSNAFDLQAQSISLTVDRKGVLKECIDDIEDWLNENLGKLKEEAARQGSRVGALGLSRSSVGSYPASRYGIYGNKYGYLFGC